MTKTLLKRLLSPELRESLIEIIVVLSMTSALFCTLQTNMFIFGLFVYVGFIWIARGVPNYKLAIITSILGGIIGFLTEYWGCSHHFWNWQLPCQSLWMINGVQDGFPIEVVAAYAGAGFWMSKLSLKMFIPEHQSAILFYAHKKYLDKFYTRISIAFIIDVIGISIICRESLLIQSVTLLMLGLNVLLFLPKEAFRIVSGFGLFVGCMGFFFENFATGFFPSFAVWKYNQAAHLNLNFPNPMIGVAPISAMFAYIGVGLLLFGLSFLLNYVLMLNQDSNS